MLLLLLCPRAQAIETQAQTNLIIIIVQFTGSKVLQSKISHIAMSFS